ncbi:MAG TPA: hypothetical protein VEB69_06675 [Acidimicrobiia bacterium]|nr:hypothetical protein [Acidimicrobiia bacterium]
MWPPRFDILCYGVNLTRLFVNTDDPHNDIAIRLLRLSSVPDLGSRISEEATGVPSRSDGADAVIHR